MKLDGTDPDGLGCGPSFASTYRMLDHRRYTEDQEWGSRERAGLRSATANRQWPQARLYRAGLATTPDCQLCLLLHNERHGNTTDRNCIASIAGSGTAVPGVAIPLGTSVHRI